jgi:hypothetical protein
MQELKKYEMVKDDPSTQLLELLEIAKNPPELENLKELRDQ